MSKINGDKARHAKRSSKQAKKRVKNLELRDLYVLPLKTTLQPALAKAKAAKPKTAAAAEKPKASKPEAAQA